MRKKIAAVVQLLLLPAQCWVFLGLAAVVNAQGTSDLTADHDNANNNLRKKGPKLREYLYQGDTASNKDPNDSLNIVMFYADDWTYRNIGKLNPLIKTPNIDKMADNGVMYKHNCVTSSICWMSRATMMTGQYSSVHQQVKPDSVGMFEHWNETLYPQLRAAGYDVGYVGKWHAPLPYNESQMAFDYSNMYSGKLFMERNGVQRHVTDLNHEDALDYLQNHRAPDKKFCLTIAFFAPHAWDGKPYPDQYMAQNYTKDLYKDVIIPKPKTATAEALENLPSFIDETNTARRRWHLRYPPEVPDSYQVSMNRYYRMLSEVDDVVGSVIDELKTQGVYNNTLLIFTSDNGQFHSEHLLAGKWFPHEESIRIPLIIQDPRMPDAVRNTTNEDFTLNIDLAPTILSAAGVPVPDRMQGSDMAELYLNPEASVAQNWRKDFFYELPYGMPVSEALVQKDIKYFYWPKNNYEQLFNMTDDPFEERDMLRSTGATSAETLEEIRKRYSEMKWLSQSGEKV